MEYKADVSASVQLVCHSVDYDIHVIGKCWSRLLESDRSQLVRLGVMSFRLQCFDQWCSMMGRVPTPWDDNNCGSLSCRHDRQTVSKPI